MNDFRMTREQREAFLADVHVGVLIVERSNSAPLASPVWYRYRPGGDVELLTEATSLKGQLLRSAGRATLCVQREELPYAYVTVDGTVTFGEPDGDDLLDIATRYLGPDGGRGTSRTRQREKTCECPSRRSGGSAPTTPVSSSADDPESVGRNTGHTASLGPSFVR